MARILPIFAICSSILFQQVAYAQGNDCAAILNGGAFNDSIINSAEKSASASLDWACNYRSSEKSQSGDVAYKAVKASYASSEAEMAQACSSNQRSSFLSKVSAEKKKEASQILIDGFNQCKSLPGAYISWTPGSNPNDFFLTYGLRTVKGFASNAVLTIDGPRDAVSCGWPQGQIRLQAGTETILACTRKNNSALNFTLNSDVYVLSNKISIAAIVPPPKCDKSGSIGHGPELSFSTGACAQEITWTSTAKISTGPIKGYETAQVVLSIPGQPDQITNLLAFECDNCSREYVPGLGTFRVPANTNGAKIFLRVLVSSRADPEKPRNLLVNYAEKKPQ